MKSVVISGKPHRYSVALVWPPGRHDIDMAAFMPQPTYSNSKNLKPTAQEKQRKLVRRQKDDDVRAAPLACQPVSVWHMQKCTVVATLKASPLH